MARIQISELPAATSAADSDLLHLKQGLEDKRITVADLFQGRSGGSGAGQFVSLSSYVEVGDTCMEDAWERMIVDLGITTNMDAYPVYIWGGDRDWNMKRPKRLFSGMTYDGGDRKHTYIATGLAPEYVDAGTYYYRRYGMFYNRPHDDGIPLRNTYITGTIYDGTRRLKLNSLVDVAVGDYLVVDLYDGGYDPTRNYSGVPLANGWEGQLHGYHPNYSRICRVEDVRESDNTVVIDTSFGWQMAVPTWPSTKRDGTSYQGLRTTLYEDTLWLSEGITFNTYERGPMNNVRIFKPNEICKDITLKNLYVVDESTASRVISPSGTERWDNYAAYVCQFYYSYNTHLENIRAEKLKMGVFLGLYNSLHRFINVSAVDWQTPMVGGEGYMCNGARGHSHVVRDAFMQGGRHLHDSTGGGHILVEGCRSEAPWDGNAEFDTHGRYEHDITYRNCNGDTIGLGMNGRYTFGAFTKRIVIDGCTFNDAFGCCVDLTISNSLFNGGFGGSFSMTLDPAKDIIDNTGNVHVGRLSIVNSVINGPIKVSFDKRLDTALDTTTVAGGHVTSASYYDPYYEAGPDGEWVFTNPFGLYISSSQLNSGYVADMYTVEIVGSRLWYTGANGAGQLEVKNCRNYKASSTFDRIEVAHSGRMRSINYTGSTFLGNYGPSHPYDGWGVIITDMENWEYSNASGVAVTYNGTTKLGNQNNSRWLSCSRSSPIAAGNLSVFLNVSGSTIVKVAGAASFNVNNISYQGAIVGNVFDTGSWYFTNESTVQPTPSTVVADSNRYTNGATNRDTGDVVFSGFNFPFASTTVPANGEIRAVIEPSGYTLAGSGYSIQANLNNLPVGCVAGVYYDNLLDNKWKIKVINAGSANQTLGSTLGTLKIRKI